MRISENVRDFIVRPVAYLSVVALAGGVTALISQHSDAWLGYAGLSAWWAGLFVATWRRILLRSAVTVVAVVALVSLAAPAIEWPGFYHDQPSGIDLGWVFAGIVRGLIAASPIFVVAALRPVLRKRNPRNPFHRPRLANDSVVLGGPRAPGHLIAAVQYCREFLKARIGEEWDISWQTGAKIAQCYRRVLECLSQGTPLPEEDKSVIRDRIERYDALIEKLRRAHKTHHAVPLWTGAHDSVRSALTDDIVTEKFSHMELLDMRDALEEFRFALRAFEEDSSRTEDDDSEIGDDPAFYRYAHEQTVEALKRVSHELGNRPPDTADRRDTTSKPAPNT